MRDGILLATINAKWIHPSLALRLLKANLGPLEERCAIVEFALRQPLREKIEPILAAGPRILGLSVSIWNHTATLELLRELRKAWKGDGPLVVLGGPEVSYLPDDAEIFDYADRRVMGEGELAFRELCQAVYGADTDGRFLPGAKPVAAHEFGRVDPGSIKTGYGLYTDEDLRGKLTYVESSRGCPYSCDFCLSARDKGVREFPLEPFLDEMDTLVRRGARTFKFLDRSFNLDIARAGRIMEFFLDRLERARPFPDGNPPFTVHFEMVPFRFPPELVETIARFPPGSLRLEIGIQTLNPDVSALVGRARDPEAGLEALRLLRLNTNAIVHADLIAGLPGEDMASFGRGFDLLWEALSPDKTLEPGIHPRVEIQLGILKLLPGAPIAGHSAAFGMSYDQAPPYEVTRTAALPAGDLDRIKNLARFWEIVVNRGLADPGPAPVFDRFMTLADSLLARFGRNWGIAKADLVEALSSRGFTGA